MKYILLIVLFVIHARASAAPPPDERAALPPCSKDSPAPIPPGALVRLFDLRKDHNPQNVLVIHTYADAQCRFIGSMDEKKRLVDMYWRMNDGTPQECYKPTHPEIKSETLKTLLVKSLSEDRTKLRLEITQLKQLNNDLPSREAEVDLAHDGTACTAKMYLQLGPKENNKRLQILGIGAKGKYILDIPTKGIKQLELSGYDDQTNSVHAVFRAK